MGKRSSSMKNLERLQKTSLWCSSFCVILVISVRLVDTQDGSKKLNGSKDDSSPTTTTLLFSNSRDLEGSVAGGIVTVEKGTRTVTTTGSQMSGLWAWKDQGSASGSRDIELQTATVRGLRIEESEKPVNYQKGVSVILADSPSVIRLFGDRFTAHTIIRFVTEIRIRGDDCDDLPSTKSFQLYKKEITHHSVYAKIQIPPFNVDETDFFMCVRENNTDMPWVHQGTEEWIVLRSYEKWLPMWAHILMLVSLLVFSGLFSGLNLGLMAIDRTELKIIGNTGSDKERRYAKKIQPLRDNGNYLLCSLLLGNVIVNSTLTILLDDLTTGLIAVIGSSLGIVIFGEIIPQAFCSRYGLAVGAQTVWITKLTMAITFPLSYPVSVLLDKILGEEIGNVYNRDRLKELIKITQSYNDLENDEVNVIEGVLKLRQITCASVMTKVDDVYMLPLEAILDFDTISEIMSSGYSRIPIYEGNRGNVVSILYAKDLAFVDPDDKMPLRTICEFYNNPCNFVEDAKPLDAMFKEFKDGNKGHMAFVQRIHISDFYDPYYEIIGIITLEDVIEELIQAEINDETDVLATNRSRRRSRGPINIMQGMAKSNPNGTHVSPQLALAAFQYLSTSIDAFAEDVISKNILERLLKQNVFFKIKFKVGVDSMPHSSCLIYERGKTADYFILILEGRVQAEMGKESLTFESGPFTYFGTQSLNLAISLDRGESPSTPKEIRKAVATGSLANLEIPVHQSLFIPDYTVRAATDVIFLRIPRSMYTTAKQATLLERSYSQGDSNARNKAGDDFDEQIDLIMNQGQTLSEIVTETSSGSISDPNGTVGSHNSKTKILGEIVLNPRMLIHSPDKNGGMNFEFMESETKNSKTHAARKLLHNNNHRSGMKPRTSIDQDGSSDNNYGEL